MQRFRSSDAMRRRQFNLSEKVAPYGRANMSMRRRNQHLLNGRRVQVVDLINDGLVEIGEKFIYRRPQAGEQHSAVVDRRGHLHLDDGRVFKTLSGAASALSGTQVDGWEVWTSERSETLLAALRQQLLGANARAASIEVSATEADTDHQRSKRHEFLVIAKERAAGTPEVITVRDLLAYWEAESRNADLDEEIDADLANYGLGTDPH